MRKYKIEITIFEGNDELWEHIKNSNSTGCDDIQAEIASVLRSSGFDFDIKLKEYIND